MGAVLEEMGATYSTGFLAFTLTVFKAANAAVGVCRREEVLL